MEEILELLRNKNYSEVQKMLIEMNTMDIVELFDELNKQEAIILFRLLHKDVSADVFANISVDQRIALTEAIKEEELQEIFNELYLDDKVDFLEELPANAVKNILRYSDAKERALINQFLNYKEDTAGSIMTVEYVSLKEYMTVGEALTYIRNNGIDKVTIYTCYILDPNKKLIGVLSLRDLVVSERDVIIRDIMNEDIIYVYTDTDQEEVADAFSKYDFVALPVVDKEKRMTGIVTVDDVLDVIEKETTEDFHIMASMTPSEGGYLQESAFKLAKDRIIWLVILLISGIFIGGIIENYNWILAQYLILNSFVPMLSGAGGNAGIQASTLAVRNISLEEITFEDRFKVMKKEFQVGLIVGSIMGVTSFLKVLLIDRVPLNIGFVVMTTMFIAIIVAKVLGGLIPLLADKIKIDPAIMSSSIITTLVDALSLIIYFSVASMLLPL